MKNNILKILYKELELWTLASYKLDYVICALYIYVGCVAFMFQSVY